MEFSQWLQISGLLVTAVTTAVTTWRGYSAVMSKLQNYVTVDEYRSKVGSLHGENNALHIRVAVLEDRAKR